MTASTMNTLAMIFWIIAIVGFSLVILIFATGLIYWNKPFKRPWYFPWL